MIDTTSALLFVSVSMILTMISKRKILLLIGIAVAIAIGVYTGLFGTGL